VLKKLGIELDFRLDQNCYRKADAERLFLTRGQNSPLRPRRFLLVRPYSSRFLGSNLFPIVEKPLKVFDMSPQVRGSTIFSPWVFDKAHRGGPYLNRRVSEKKELLCFAFH
jgi:hypothetical protein